MEQQKTSDAATAVLQTTELLELTLAHLPFEDLLQARKVSRQWHDLITHSQTLIPRLFLKPAAPTACSDLTNNVWKVITDEDDVPRFGVLNPLLVKAQRPSPVCPDLEIELKPSFLKHVLSSLEGHLASMVVTQPAVQVIRVKLGGRLRCKTLAGDYILRRTEGIRIGDIFENARSLLLDKGCEIDDAGKVHYIQEEHRERVKLLSYISYNPSHYDDRLTWTFDVFTAKSCSSRPIHDSGEF